MYVQVIIDKRLRDVVMESQNLDRTDVCADTNLVGMVVCSPARETLHVPSRDIAAERLTQMRT